MDLVKKLQDARIIRVAIVDDDLSQVVSTESLRTVDADVAALLNDVNDPDRQAYLALLKQREYAIPDDLAFPLSDQDIRNDAPERLRNAANQVLEARNGNAAPVHRVRELLRAAGIQDTNVDIYFKPDIPAGRHYDLLIVDYYLVNDDANQTVPFIQQVVREHTQQEQPLQIILMSSHEASLQLVFRELRPRVEVSSSRMRILAKPQGEAQLACWKLTLDQLATDRRYVSTIECFLRESIASITQAALQQSAKLWELDLQAMHLLYETSESDNDDYCRYVEEALSRHLSTHLEESHQLRGSIVNLRDCFTQEGNGLVVSSGAEIGDSRAAIRGLMGSMEWRGKTPPRLPDYPAIEALPTPEGQSPEQEEEGLAAEKRDDLARCLWVKKALRFGMVFQDPEQSLWLNVTQSCDLAQAKEGLPHISLLFVRGIKKTYPVSIEGSKVVDMNTSLHEGEPGIISWQLQRVLAVTVSEFAKAYPNGWNVVGELRQDQAQNVVSKFGAQATRVALQKSLRSWIVFGFAMKLGTLRSAVDAAPVTGLHISGHALQSKNDCQIHFDVEVYNRLVGEFDTAVDEKMLELCRGFKSKPANHRQLGSGIFIYCETAAISMGQLRGQVARAHKQWFDKAENDDKLVIAVWTA